jgi:hypothetical protein
MFLMTDVQRSNAVIRTADFKRGRDKRKRKKKKDTGFRDKLEGVKVGQKIASTGSNISREVRSWINLTSKLKKYI